MLKTKILTIIALGFVLCFAQNYRYNYQSEKQPVQCSYCKGTGCGMICYSCKGTGIVHKRCFVCSGSGLSFDRLPCISCQGNGYKIEKCARCMGTGCGEQCFNCRGTGIVLE